jgi:exo-beta-1,3-glucanase (GH17 family)/cellulose synthase/poly-beta-1,6-N-acetylglucosamine synthase-like glycosyltransferase
MDAQLQSRPEMAAASSVIPAAFPIAGTKHRLSVRTPFDWLFALLIALMMAVATVTLWGGFNRPVDVVDWTGKIHGVSFSAYQKDQNPYAQTYPTERELEADIAKLRDRVTYVRTYSSAHGFEAVPQLAQKYGLKVTAGAWLNKSKDNNALEYNNLIRNADTYPNITRVIIGNETLLRGDLTVQELSAYLRYARKRLRQPVSTAEPWDQWLLHPELAKSVDYIAIHVLPYWEKVPAEQSVDWVVQHYDMVKKRFPGKMVVIDETGWPSAGSRQGPAKPSLVNAASFARDFIKIAQERRIEYFIMEAFDQPWKRLDEGNAGPHWGMFNADRESKYPLTGAIIPDKDWRPKAVAAVLLALLPIFWFVARRTDLRPRGRLFFAMLLQMAAAAVIWASLIPHTEDLSGLSLWMWALLFPAQLLLLLMMLVNGLEMAEIIWHRRLRRHFSVSPALTLDVLPKVSLHLPIHNEPPAMVFETLNSLARLDYPDFEVLVLDNNTRDSAVWQPVRDYCERLGQRFRFFHLENWPGYKAGALNFGLRNTDPAAAIIGVIDSDYVVTPDWLQSLVPHFARDGVAFVQAPQDHRAWQESAFKTMCNWEYNGFFEIGMVLRNERNAIIQHGTMTLIRKQALWQAGAWGEWCICEDAELGLRLLAEGHESVYVNHVFGRGVVPETFAAYKNQRFRWVYGAVQIFKHHWRELFLPGKGRLTAGQRFHFVSGWLPWFADALHLVFTLAGLFWSIGMLAAPRQFELPLEDFLIPTLGVFGFKILHSLMLYDARVKCGWRERLGAALAGMSLTHTIARAIFTGLFTHTRPFLRTPKVESRAAWVQGLAMAREEGMMALALVLAAVTVIRVLGVDDLDTLCWVAILLVQALPNLAAVVMGVLSVLPPDEEPASASQSVLAPQRA